MRRVGILEVRVNVGCSHSSGVMTRTLPIGSTGSTRSPQAYSCQSGKVCSDISRSCLPSAAGLVSSRQASSGRRSQSDERVASPAAERSIGALQEFASIRPSRVCGLCAGPDNEATIKAQDGNSRKWALRRWLSKPDANGRMTNSRFLLASAPTLPGGLRIWQSDFITTYPQSVHMIRSH